MDDKDRMVRPVAQLIEREVTELSSFTPAVSCALAGALHILSKCMTQRS